MRKLIGTTMCVGLLLAASACGGGSGGDQGDVADKLIEAAEGEDMNLDEDCVREVAGKFSDDDANMIADNFDDEEMPDISPEGQALLIELFGCAEFSDIDFSTGDLESLTDIGSVDIPTIDQATLDSFIDQAVANLPDNIDEDCFRDALSGVDPEQLSSGQAPELAAAIASCVSGG